jgi:hypothetical protein
MRAFTTGPPIFSSCSATTFLACDLVRRPVVTDRSNLGLPSGLMINIDYFAEKPKEESTVSTILADFLIQRELTI